MKATAYLSFVVVIGIFVLLTINGATNLNEKFPQHQINTSNFSESYNNIDAINTRVNETYYKFQILGAEDTSWFQKIGAGIVAIPYAVINFPIIIGMSVTSLMSMTKTALGGIVPMFIIIGILTFILVEIVSKFLEFFQRARA